MFYFIILFYYSECIEAQRKAEFKKGNRFSVPVKPSASASRLSSPLIGTRGVARIQQAEETSSVDAEELDCHEDSDIGEDFEDDEELEEEVKEELAEEEANKDESTATTGTETPETENKEIETKETKENEISEVVQ